MANKINDWKWQDLYDEIGWVVTWYDHPETCPHKKEEIPKLMCNVLLKVQDMLNKLNV